MKRAIFGVGAVVSAGVLSVTSVFAANPLDYANSIGQVNESDTINLVIEATKDGGYIVGGQTVGCFKEEYGAVALYDGGAKNSSGVEFVSIQECIEYYETYPNDVWWDTDRSLVDQLCGDSIKKNDEEKSSDKGYKSIDDSSYYYYSCVDYVAKFKQDGTKEWLTPIEDGSTPVAVGETNGDYRLITTYGTIHTINKTDGTEGLAGQLATDYVRDAIVNEDGTTIALTGWDGVTLYGANGNESKRLGSGNYDENGNLDYYGLYGSGNIGDSLVKVDDGFLLLHETESRTLDDETGDYNYEVTKMELVKVSNDLNTVTSVVDFTNDEEIKMIIPLSSDENNNIMAFVVAQDSSSGKIETLVVSYDSEGQQLASESVYDFFGVTEEEMNGWTDDEADEFEEGIKFLDNYTVINPKDNELVRFAPDLSELFTYALADGEVINDLAVLTDGSTAGVGSATQSTDNYDVAGAMNGTYLRFAKVTAANGAANPQTADNIKLYAAGAATIILLAGGLIMKGGKRR